MEDHRREWTEAANSLISMVKELGFPEELGEQIAKQLGSPKAINRMTAYLHYERPKSAEIIVDEMLAICSDIERWRDKKAAEEANAKNNEIYRLFE